MSYEEKQSTDFERGACRIVEIENTNDDDASEAKPCSYEVPNDLEDRAADLKKFTR